jgi:hypothetical protein
VMDAAVHRSSPFPRSHEVVQLSANRIAFQKRPG